MIATLFGAYLLFANPAQLDCPMTSMSAAEREAFETWVGEKGNPNDPRRVPFARNVADCAARHGWSEAAATSAWSWRLVTSAQAHLRRALANRGFRVEGVEAAIVADTALMRALAGDEMQTSVAAFIQRRNDLFGAFLRSVPEGEREAVLTELADFVAMHGLEHIFRTGFAAQ